MGSSRTQHGQEGELSHRGRLRKMGIGELIEAWEEPMPDEVRALLLDEIKVRGYRIKSLPEPPSSDAATTYAPTFEAQHTGPQCDLAVAEKTIGRGAVAAFIYASLSLLVVSVAVATDSDGALGQWNDPWNFFDVGLFFVLAIGVRRKSRTAAILLAAFLVLVIVLRVVETEGILPLPIGLIFLFFFARAIPGAFVYHRIRRADDPSYGRPSRAAWVVGTLGGLFGLALIGLMILSLLGPPLAVTAGEDLGGDYLRLLRKEGILEEGEQVVLFYSAGLFSILENGNIVTNRRVISYESAGNEFWVASARYDEIFDVVVQENGGAFQDTTFLVTPMEGDAFCLLASTEEDGDELFLQEIRSRISSAR